MVKEYNTIMMEGVVVGVGLLAIYMAISFVLDLISDYFKLDRFNLPIKLFISGYLFHIVCEYTGVNVWYSLAYCDLLK